MTLLIVSLLIIGAVFIIGSFFIGEKLSDSDVEEIQKLSKEEIERIIKDKMADARSDMEDQLAEAIDEAMENLDRKTDKETTDKIQEISDYSDGVLKAVEDSHKEVMFMYSMLNSKQENVTEMTAELQDMLSKLRALNTSIDRKMEEAKNIELKLPPNEEITVANPIEVKPSPSFNEEMTKKFSAEESKGNGNLDILNLHDEGYSEVEIAKKLGRGLGEVKFVLGLYQEDN